MPRARSTSGSTPSPRAPGSRSRSASAKGSIEAPAAAAEVKAPAAKRRRRPLTERQLIDRLLKLLGQGPPKPTRSSVRIALGPRRQVMPEVLAHLDDDPDVVAKLSAVAQAEFDRLIAKYYPEGLGLDNGDDADAVKESAKRAAIAADVARAGKASA